MPNGHGPKEYGPHKYADHYGTSDCQFHCGCWAGPVRSGGPVGLDPLGGACPRNPKDGQLLGGSADYEHVVTERIRSLETRLYHAETAMKAVKPSKKKLAEEMERIKAELYKKNNAISELKKTLQKLETSL